MLKKILFLLAIVVAILLPGFLFAQIADPTPALTALPVLTATPVPGPMPYTGPGLSPDLLKHLEAYAIAGGAWFLMISGLKNVPFFADLFAKWPKLAVIVNAIGAFLIAAVGCIHEFGAATIPFVSCLLTAVGIFLSAAGWHFVKFSLSPKSAIAGPGGEEKTALSPSVSAAVRSTLDAAVPVARSSSSSP
ncbi:MAG: hypothetical protein M3167_06255 [Acidobacteriota bacterium]|nr:hypothetical protein [Acidobacteriota bacterium]MDQ6892266.1 hypothetical protein [Acidobacteriota bacterium]